MPPCSPPSSPGCRQHVDFRSPRSSRCGRVGGGCSREPTRAHFFRSRLPFSCGSRRVHKESITLLPTVVYSIEIFSTLFVFVCQAHPRPPRATSPLPVARLFPSSQVYENSQVSSVNYRHDLAETHVSLRAYEPIPLPSPPPRCSSTSAGADGQQ